VVLGKNPTACDEMLLKYYEKEAAQESAGQPAMGSQ